MPASGNSYSQLGVGMVTMPTTELLPGVSPESCPPSVVCDARRAIRRARVFAFVRDAVQVVLLVGVNFLFLRWPESHLPFAGRALSLKVLEAMSVLLIAHIWIMRALPRWTARRIAATWCRSEQQRFFAAKSR